jgi:hypothetical protein
MRYRYCLTLPLILVCLLMSAVSGQESNEGIDPEVIIDRILTVDLEQRRQIKDVTFDAEYVEGEEKDGEFQEKVRFDKKVYIKYFEDTAWYHEEYIAYYKDGELKSQEDLRKQARERKEKKQKRKTRDISFPMITPFYPDERQFYEIEYVGVTEEPIDGYICHQFRVTSKEEDPDRINGDYYFDADSFHLVRVDFSPAKLVKKAVFKMQELNMSVRYGPTPDDVWLPRQFDIEGRGKAMFLFGVKFAGTEYYRNPIINTGLKDELFEVNDDE